MARIEDLPRIENERQKDNLPIKDRYLMLSQLRGKAYAFSTESTDEFRAIREDGSTQGIFKTWALPVIPFLDTYTLPSLIDAWPVITETANGTESFSSSIHQLSDGEDIRGIGDTLDWWHGFMLEHPEALRKSLDRSLSQSHLVDRRLTEIYASRQTPEDPKEHLAELINRLEVATTLTSPFYNIEALVGDANGFEWNPIATAESDSPEWTPGGGGLDAQALLLPAAFQDIITTSQGNWNELTWEKIRCELEKLSGDKERFAIIHNVASLLAVPLEFVLFGLNALEMIPMRVGGKKSDFSIEDAVESIHSLTPSTMDTPIQKIIGIGRDTNAKIRFHNWLPLVADNEVIEKGTKWTYASTCDVSNQLLQFAINHPEIWNDDFQKIFTEQLLPQILYFDATSAKGRFLLQLIKYEQHIKPEYIPAVLDIQTQISIIDDLVQVRENEYVQTIGSSIQPRSIVGGKIFGLEETAINSGIDINILPGVKINSEWVADFIDQDPDLRQMIYTLTIEQEMPVKLTIADEIRSRIKGQSVDSKIIARVLNKLPQTSRFAIRSSSYDEDSASGQTAAGIYESVIDVTSSELNAALSECLSSYFSDKAIRYREMTGSDHAPDFALLVQKFVPGIGGVAFTKDLHSQKHGVVIEASNDSVSVTAGKNGHSRYEENSEGLIEHIAGEIKILPKNLEKIRDISARIKEIKGADVDIEWVQDHEGKLWILQMRALPKELHFSTESEPEFLLEIPSDQPLNTLTNRLQQETGSGILHLRGDQRDLDAFQGELFGIVAKNKKKITEIWLDRPIPTTSHFANICASLGIRIKINYDQ